MATSRSKISPAKRAPRADALENRKRILEAAHARFANQGLAADMDAIARDAGVAVGTLYHHFGTKEALLEAIVLEALQEFERYLHTLTEEPDPWIAIEKLVNYIAERQSKDQAFAALISAQPALHAVTRATKRSLGPLMHQILHRAQSANLLRSDVEPADLPRLLAGLAETDSTPASRQRYIAIVLNGLRIPKDSKHP